MYKCITCGTELHPERAKKYNYCMSPECQEKNAKGLMMVAVGVNKSAEQYLILDERTKEEIASGKYHDQRRGTFGTSLPGPAAQALASPGSPAAGTAGPAADVGSAAGQAGPRPRAAAPETQRQAPGQQRSAGDQRQRAARQPAPAPRQPRRTAHPPWSKSQQKLALLYNEQGLRPDEIAQKLGLSRYLVSQIILTSRNRGKL
jgi:hypothetical protein